MKKKIPTIDILNLLLAITNCLMDVYKNNTSGMFGWGAASMWMIFLIIEERKNTVR